MTDSDLWKNQIIDFISYLKTERQLSEHTTSNYLRDLEKFAHFCRTKNINDSSHAHGADVRQWIAQMHSGGLAGTSLKRALSALRSFYKYSSRYGSKHNPAIDIQAPKSPKRLPNALDIDNMQQLLSIEGNDWLSIRDRAILELFYSCGLRLSELVNLNIQDLDINDSLITVTGKGNKTRSLPLGSYAKKAMQDWLAVREVGDSNQSIFISKLGSRLSQRSIQLRLKKHSQLQGVNQHVHPHMLRHSFASHILESSGDLRAVQELLGHANISTTQVYTHLDFQHLSKIYDKSHPRAIRKSDPTSTNTKK